MQRKILAVVYVVLLAVLLLASAHLARVDLQAERDFYECLQPESLLLLPDANNIQTCMLMKGYSDEETTDIISSVPDQDFFAPDTGDLGGRGNQG